jgi:hypothetical protein
VSVQGEVNMKKRSRTKARIERDPLLKAFVEEGLGLIRCSYEMEQGCKEMRALVQKGPLDRDAMDLVLVTLSGQAMIMLRKFSRMCAFADVAKPVKKPKSRKGK